VRKADLSSPRPIRSAAFWVSLALLLLASAAHADRVEHVFFQGTQYPLAVVFIQGERPGPTVMVQGGIQGDESAGFLTAQALSLSRVLAGNLIVVPRANVPSIHLRQRQIYVDMNRRFDQEHNRFYEDRVARVIRFLLAQSNAFIHLHEGSGFHRNTWEDGLRNPNRWGQSIIVDTLSFEGGIDLAGTAMQVIEEINREIEPADYRFTLFNTRTFDAASPYRSEMRKTLTFYALTALRIPAFAVEVSKEIKDLDWKVRHQLLATTRLLMRCGVEIVPPELPAVGQAALAEREARVRINGSVLGGGGTIRLSPGATLAVEPAARPANPFSPALAVFASDRPGVNLLAAPRMALEAFNDLELRADGRRLFKASVRWSGRLPPKFRGPEPVFVCWLNGSPRFIKNGQSLRAVAGDQLILEGVWGSKRKEILNFKGFVANPRANDGQDMGYEVILDPENFLDRYRLAGPDGAARYLVARETACARGAQFFVDVEPRRVQSLRLIDAKGQSLVVPWTPGAVLTLPRGEYVLEGIVSNGAADKLVTTAGRMPLRTGEKLALEAGRPLDLTLRQATTFAGLGMITLSAAASLAEADVKPGPALSANRVPVSPARPRGPAVN